MYCSNNIEKSIILNAITIFLIIFLKASIVFCANADATNEILPDKLTVCDENDSKCKEVDFEPVAPFQSDWTISNGYDGDTHVCYDHSFNLNSTNGNPACDEWALDLTPPDPNNGEILSIFDGVVAKIKCDGSYGQSILIYHGYFIDSQDKQVDVYSRYSHLTKDSQKVEEGEKISKGTPIGVYGDTGWKKDSDGNVVAQCAEGVFGKHLHFAMYKVFEQEGTKQAYSAKPDYLSQAEQLNIGDCVKVSNTDGTTVRDKAAGADIGVQKDGAIGTVEGGPQNEPYQGIYYDWYKINWETKPEGWEGDEPYKGWSVGKNLVAIECQAQPPTPTSNLLVSAQQPDENTVFHPGDTLNWSLTIQNSGNADLESFKMSYNTSVEVDGETYQIPAIKPGLENSYSQEGSFIIPESIDVDKTYALTFTKNDELFHTINYSVEADDDGETSFTPPNKTSFDICDNRIKVILPLYENAPKLKIRPNASTDDDPKAEIVKGSIGKILEGPKKADGLEWYRIKWDVIYKDDDKDGVIDKCIEDECKVTDLEGWSVINDGSQDTFWPACYYSDVTENTLQVEAITYLSNLGIVSGYGVTDKDHSYGEFGVNNTVLRSEFSKMIVESIETIENEGIEICDIDKDKVDKCFEKKDEDYQNEALKFGDLKEENREDWYTVYIGKLLSKEFVKGYDNGDFLPGNKINKAELLKMIIMPFYPPSEDEYIDCDDDDEWYCPYVVVAQNHNIRTKIKEGALTVIEKKSDGIEETDKEELAKFATRAETAQAIYDAIKPILEP